MPRVSDEEAVRLRDLIERAGKAPPQPPPAVGVEAGPANDRQVGGSHYRDVELAPGAQHWDVMWNLYREAWFVGNVTKYVLRYRTKEGLKDLRKARHYLDKLIELEEAEARNAASGPAPGGTP